MQDAHPIVPGLHAPPGEPLPLVVRLVEPAAARVARLQGLGAFVAVSGRDATGPWPRAVAEAVDECRRRFGRAYVVRHLEAARPRIAAGIPGTPAHDADPWSVALLVAAARGAGLDAPGDPARPGRGTSDALQGFELELPPGADDVLVAVVGALADGLRLAQLRC